MEIFPSQIIFTFDCQHTAPLTEHAIFGFVFRSWNFSAHGLTQQSAVPECGLCYRVSEFVYLIYLTSWEYGDQTHTVADLPVA